jgi:hypothetical protein
MKSRQNQLKSFKINIFSAVVTFGVADGTKNASEKLGEEFAILS